MSFKTTPIPSTQTAQTQPSQAQQSGRERAIAMLTQGNPVNQNNVAPEDLSAVAPQAPDNGQKASNEATTPEPEKPVVTEEKALSPQYAALARKEKQLRAQVQQFKAQQAAFKAEQDALKAQASQAQAQASFEERLATDPLGVLAEKGWSYDKLTQAALNQPTPIDPEIVALKQEIKALRAEQEKSSKAQVDQQTASYKQAVNQIRQDTKNLVQSDPEFETISATNSVDDVVELIERTFNQDGVLLSVEEAARAVEEYLVEEGMKIARLKKIQQKLAPAKAPAQQQQSTTKQPQQQMKTLTNAVASTRQLSAKERAILAFKGELKN